MAAAETVAGAIARGARYLERRGLPEARRNARFLVAHVLGTDLGGLVTAADRVLTLAEGRRLGRLLCARGGRRPLQHLLGTWEFYGLELEVDARALIPRPDTETLVERVLTLLPPGPRRLLDLGTGTGCIAIALAASRADLQVVAIDIDPDALALAAANVARHALESRVQLLQGDLFALLAAGDVGGLFDAVVSNPPYIRSADIAGLAPEVRVHDPRSALDGGATGFAVIDRLLAGAGAWLAAGGLLALEVGDDQAEATLARAVRAGYVDVRAWPDLGGTLRVVTAYRSMMNVEPTPTSLATRIE